MSSGAAPEVGPLPGKVVAKVGVGGVTPFSVTECSRRCHFCSLETHGIRNLARGRFLLGAAVDQGLFG